eukprot:6182015-Pleurochrysis_carterae.AAC.4
MRCPRRAGRTVSACTRSRRLCKCAGSCTRARFERVHDSCIIWAPARAARTAHSCAFRVVPASARAESRRRRLGSARPAPASRSAEGRLAASGR